MSQDPSHPRIQTPFGQDSTALEVVEGIDLTGKRAIVTGGASGIGVETARALAAAGAEVTIAVRNTTAGERVAAEIGTSTGNAVHVAPLELMDRASIEAFTSNWEGPLDILVNNAGVMAIQELTLAPDGHESQFSTNHLGHFALALGLHGALAAAPDGARIVAVSSSGHLRSPIVWDDIDFAFRNYEPFLAYGQSKTANVLFAVEASRRWAGDGITANALMPGGIFTNLQRHVGGSDYIERAKERFKDADVKFKTPEEGAATSVLLATSPLLTGIGGRYFEDCNESEVLTRRTENTLSGVAAYAVDPAGAERLWDVSLEMLG